MCKANQRRGKRERGSALVESGLTFMVFMMVIFGLMDFGRMVWADNLLSHATREATRYAMVHGSHSISPATADNIKSVVTSQAVGLDPSKISVDVSWTPDNKPGSSVKVAAQYTFTPMTGFVGSGKFGSVSQVIISQ